MVLKNSEFRGIWDFVVLSVFLFEECVYLSSSELVRIAPIDLCENGISGLYEFSSLIDPQ